MHALALAAAANVLIVLYTPLPGFPASLLGNLALLDYPTASIYYFYPIVLSQFALAQSARANVNGQTRLRHLLWTCTRKTKQSRPRRCTFSPTS